MQELTVNELCPTAQSVVGRPSEVGKGDVEVWAAHLPSVHPACLAISGPQPANAQNVAHFRGDDQEGCSSSHSPPTYVAFLGDMLTEALLSSSLTGC